MSGRQSILRVCRRRFARPYPSGKRRIRRVCRFSGAQRLRGARDFDEVFFVDVEVCLAEVDEVNHLLRGKHAGCSAAENDFVEAACLHIFRLGVHFKLFLEQVKVRFNLHFACGGGWEIAERTP